MGVGNRTDQRAMRRPEISIVIPAHNSADLIEQTAMSLADRLRDRTAEIIVVENGSSDDTLQRCERLAEGWRRGSVTLSVLQSAKGMGNALRAGVLASHGHSVLLTADDLPFGFDDLDAADRLVASTGGMPPFLIGSKAHPESTARRGTHRSILASGFAMLRRVILDSRVGDSQGTLLVDGTLVRNLAPNMHETGFLFSTELVYLAELGGVHPVEVPVRLRPEHRQHRSRVRLSDVLLMAWGLGRLRLRYRARPRRTSVIPRSGLHT